MSGVDRQQGQDVGHVRLRRLASNSTEPGPDEPGPRPVRTWAEPWASYLLTASALAHDYVVAGGPRDTRFADVPFQRTEKDDELLSRLRDSKLGTLHDAHLKNLALTEVGVDLSLQHRFQLLDLLDSKFVQAVRRLDGVAQHAKRCRTQDGLGEWAMKGLEHLDFSALTERSLRELVTQLDRQLARVELELARRNAGRQDEGRGPIE